MTGISQISEHVLRSEFIDLSRKSLTMDDLSLSDEASVFMNVEWNLDSVE